LLAVAQRGDQRLSSVLFRRKDGSRQSFNVIGVESPATEGVAIAVLERQPQPWRAAPLTGTAGGK
jgi:hypothetical protein